jgi:dihydroxyacetone kinase-like predicted kinase
MNPSTQEILDAIEACPAERVVVLPNNKNVVLAAHQAVEHTGTKVEIVPTTSVPQGVAALLAFSPELDLESNVAAMTAAADSVRSAEVTRAVRSTTVAGRRVAEGEAIGVIDGELCIAEQEIEDAVQACVRRMVWPEATILTLYFGQEMGRQEAESLAERLRAEYSSLERVEVFDGGQPHYPYLISVSAE